MGRRKAKNIDDLFVLNVVGIARESAAIYLQHLSLFTSIALFLLSPLSAALILCRALLPHAHIVANFSLQIGAFGRAAGFPNSRYAHLICNKLSQAVIAYMLCFPFVLTFSLLARAAVAHTVAYIYAGGKRPSWQKVIQALPNLWKRLVLTYMSGGLIVLGSNVMILASVSVIIKFLSVLGFSSNWEIGAALCGGIVYSIVFAHAMVVCNLAAVVCVMEECNYGMEGAFRAMFLMRGRTRIALVMAVIINLGWAFVESLFEYRVMGNMNMAWEGPLLVFMYSMVGVMDSVMTSVFYYTCKSSRLEDVCQCRFFWNCHQQQFNNKIATQV